MVEQTTAAAAGDRKIIYYHDPSGAPFWSAEPKKDASGRDHLPIFEDEDISFEPGGKKPVPTAGSAVHRSKIFRRMSIQGICVEGSRGRPSMHFRYSPKS